MEDEKPLAIPNETLQAERERLKATLRELETGQRKLEAELKLLRQKEIRTKRQIEALTTLLEINEPADDAKEKD